MSICISVALVYPTWHGSSFVFLHTDVSHSFTKVWAGRGPCLPTSGARVPSLAPVLAAASEEERAGELGSTEDTPSAPHRAPVPTEPHSIHYTSCPCCSLPQAQASITTSQVSFLPPHFQTSPSTRRSSLLGALRAEAAPSGSASYTFS